MLLAHISDPHVIDWHGLPLKCFRGKRFSGWLNFKLNRGRRLRRDVLERILEDIRAQSPDHVTVTGDVSSLGFRQEMQTFGRLLDTHGFRGDDLSLVPGNHDAYTPDAWRGDRLLSELGRFCTSDLHGGMPGFPFVRLRGPLALVGLDSAVARPGFTANGQLGHAQIRRLVDVLRCSEVRSRFPVVLVHHPPLAYPRWLKEVQAGLFDRASFLRAMESGLEGRPALVLSGHWHFRHRSVLDLPGPVEVLTISSASFRGGGERRQAAYHLIRFRETPPGIRGVEVRGYDPARGQVVTLAKWSGRLSAVSAPAR